MADFRLGRLKFKWRGDWVASTKLYLIDDIVKFGANSMFVLPITPPQLRELFYGDLSNWDIHTEGLRHRGEWQGGTGQQGQNLNTYYKINDVVKYGNSQYRCIEGHTSSANIDFAKWSLYAEGLKFEDTYVNTTAYQLGDIVTFGGYSYIALQNSTGIAPNTDGTAWAVISTGFSAQGVYTTSEVYEAW